MGVRVLSTTARPGVRLRSPALLPLPPLPLASLAVDLSPANITVAPARSTDDATPTLEHSIGELVAQTAAALAAGLREVQNGRLSATTKARGGDLVMRLYILRRLMIGSWDFDGICREHGTAALRETCGSEVDVRTIDILVDGALEVLATVVRKAVN